MVVVKKTALEKGLFFIAQDILLFCPFDSAQDCFAIFFGSPTGSLGSRWGPRVQGSAECCACSHSSIVRLRLMTCLPSARSIPLKIALQYSLAAPRGISTRAEALVD